MTDNLSREVSASSESVEEWLREDVARICPPSGRMVGSQGRRQARDYLSRRLKDLGLRPYRGSSFGMAYRDSGQKFFNLVGVVPCGNGAQPPVLIGAHYFHTESMGSTRFYRDQMLPEGMHAAIVMDLVGHNVSVPIPGASKMLPGLKDIVCFTGAESHPEMAGILGTQDFGHLVPIATPNSNVGDMSDHHIFRKNGVPYLFLSCGRWPHYHQETDTPERLNYSKIRNSLGTDSGNGLTLTSGFIGGHPLRIGYPPPRRLRKCAAHFSDLWT